jgi:hypothetical protein
MRYLRATGGSTALRCQMMSSESGVILRRKTLSGGVLNIAGWRHIVMDHCTESLSAH